MRKLLTYFFLLLLTIPVFGQENMNIITYNIRYNNPDDGVNAWPNRKADVIALLKFHKADVFCVQEALHDQIVDLKEGMRTFDYVGVGRDNGKQAGEYSAIFYDTRRYRLQEQGHFWLSETPNKPGLGWDAACVRICSWAKLRDQENNQSFFVFTTHFDHVGVKAREESAKLIYKKVQELGGDRLPVFLTGDLNLTPEANAIALIRSQWKDSRLATLSPPYGPVGTFEGFDFNSPLKNRIDYIFVNDKLRVLRYGVLSDSKEQRYPSDHLPVLVEAKFID
ncbi:endonuclease/exonuclease/phosphatase family protein [Prolixibacter denitrificans]|uniref:Endonuclease/exonuclease/phosphatase family metal-dependent hydrolase n=2 Tax=Prolixibacter denitrificans TaxID=1541063 RepID=A0A2P8C9I1_9BACT|nr:endonuclease/exonuclease/phosphatase family protein [Prolixibacter denitrificans]PSK81622.1 endonuclease/exonuclease/phosphatase family metal-dependent hydrolase [Prolixibacter denitrificans]